MAADFEAIDRVVTREEFGQALDDLRQARGWSLRRLAREVDSSASTIGDWCRGDRLPFPSSQDIFVRLLQALGVDRVAPWLEALARARQAPDASRAPYPGLEPFDTEDADLFFGRADLVARCASVVHDLVDGRAESDGPAAVVLVGPSGVGKSSLVRAGLVPRLEEDGLATAVTSPSDGADRVLAGVEGSASGDEATPDVVVVDQFEQAFTGAAAVRAGGGLPAQVLATADHVPVVVTLRVDFYVELAATPGWQPVLEDHQVVVGAMDDAELRAAIVEPARVVGLAVDDDLVEVLLRDLQPGSGNGNRERAGMLPLLSHALRETWQVSNRMRLTTSDYLEAGGVGGALERSAERVYEHLSPDAQALARQVLLRLVTVEDGGVATTRPVSVDDLAGLVDDDVDADALSVVDAFVQARLLVRDQSRVHVAHDALLDGWDRLGGWIDEVSEQLLQHRRLTRAADAWEASGRERGLLLRGRQLESARMLRAGHASGGGLALSDREAAFLSASVRAHEQQQEREAKRRRRLRWLTAAAVVFGVVAASLAVVAGVSRSREVAARDEASSRHVSAIAERLADNDTTVAAQVAVGGLRIADTPDARSAVLDLWAGPRPHRALGGAGSTAVAVAPGAGLAAFSNATAGTVQLVSSAADGLDRVGTVTVGEDLEVYALEFYADGTRLAIGDTSATTTTWDVSEPATPRQVGDALSGPEGPVQDIAVSPAGDELAAVGLGQGVYRWAVDDGVVGDALATLPFEGVTWSVAHHPDGDHVAATTDTGEVVIWEAGSEPVEVARRQVGERRMVGLSFSPDGATMAVGATVIGNNVGRLATWDTTDLADPQPLEWADPEFASFVTDTAFSGDGTRLAAGSSTGDVRVWDVTTGWTLRDLTHPANVTQVTFGDDHGLYSVAVDGTLRGWDLAHAAPPVLDGRVFSVDFTADGSRVAVFSGETVGVWDINDPDGNPTLGPLVASLPGDPTSAGTGGISPDGTLLARGSLEGQLRLYDLTAGAEPRRITIDQGDSESVVQGAAFNADGTLVAAGGADTRLRTWVIDGTDTTLATARESDHGQALGVAFSPTTNLLAVARASGVVQLFTVATDGQVELQAELDAHDSETYALAFTPDGDLLATGGNDGTIVTWDVTTPAGPSRHGIDITGPTGRIFKLSYDQHGDRLAASITDGTVWLFDVTNPDQPRRHAVLGPIGSTLFGMDHSPTADALIASGGDGRVRLWTTDIQRATNEICATVGTPLTNDEWQRSLPDTEMPTICPG